MRLHTCLAVIVLAAAARGNSYSTTVDGFGTPCPCGNSGATGNGCAASYNSAGANLAWSGTPNVANDSLTLIGTGTSTTPIRLGVTISSAGLSQYPFGAAPAVSIQGQIPSGGLVTRCYQAYFRDSASFCGPATFNLTNATAVPWQP